MMIRKATKEALPKRFQTQVEISRAHINTLRGIILLMALICGGLWYGWISAPSHMTVHIPPDLRSSSEQTVGAIPPHNVYVFALYFWQQIHRWPENGENDYAKNIHRYQNFMTPRFYDWLDKDFQAKAGKGELRNKVRGIAEIPGHHFEADRVVVLGDGTWLVWLDLEVKEWVDELNTKTVRVRYPLRVVRFDIDPQHNPWGLALDGFSAGQQPSRLPDQDSGDNS